ncbi:MAG: DUF2764 family protein [Bacteroidales bacterium]|nr:DUF2764 family protein [Bacteroidales bacterium]
MNNFEYIVSSLPVLTPEYRYSAGESYSETLEEIRAQLSRKDAAVMDFLLKGFNAEALNKDFYAEALSHSNAFIREFFRFDLNLRNAKVRYINRRLGRPSEQDTISGKGLEDDSKLDIDGYRFNAGEFHEAAKVESTLSLSDLISREKGLDEVTWEKADALTTFHYFDLTAVLGFIVKLHIVDRWISLDPESGRQLFRRLVDQVRGTFKGVNYTE